MIKRETENTEGYYVYNGHGDVTKIIDTTNEELNTYVYDEFGSIKEENETFNNPFKYAGYYYDNETKTYYLRSRYYNPEIQRFISEDTYRGELNDPLSLNYYTYSNNNPLIYYDPTGHFFEQIGAGLKYVTERITAAFEAGGELIGDAIYGTLSLGYSIAETGVSEAGLISNYLGNKVGIIGKDQYEINKESLLSTITKNGQMYSELPKNMLNGIKDNLLQTFNLDNFKNYWNPNTSYEELKDYSKSVIQTGLTIYGGAKVLQTAYNGVTGIVKSIQNSKINTSTVNPKDVRFMQDSIKNQTGNYTVLENANGLKNGSINPNDIPISNIWKDSNGNLWTLSNRRLASFKLSGLNEMPVTWASPEQIANQMWKMTTKTNGMSIKLKLGNNQNIIIK